jgi:hypothetical protein
VNKEWKKVATRDIKYEYSTLAELLSWIKQSVPEGTKEEDILIEVEVDDTKGYYDDIIITAEMKLSVRKL